MDAALSGFDADQMNEDVSRGARSLSNIKPDILVYACTSGAYHKGCIQFDREMSEEMQLASGVESIAAVGACIEAFSVMGSKRLSIAGPYRHFHLRHRLKPLAEASP